MQTRDDQTHFGFRDVPLSEKQGMVDEVFHSVAGRYDLMNDLMSAGLHRAWKDALVTAINPPRGPQPFHLLDVGSGTKATVFDINGGMLAVGRERIAKLGRDDAIDFIEGNAEELPFPDKSFDAYSIAFGIRNVPRIDQALKEAYRVLRPGSRFVCLEFSMPDLPGLDRLYDLYSFNVIPALGGAVTGDRESYRYLVESIRQFPAPQRFADMIAAAGFRRASFTRLSGGIVCIHSGWRL